VRISPEILSCREADVFPEAEGSIWRRPLLRGRADSPGSLAQGMLHRDGPGTEEMEGRGKQAYESAERKHNEALNSKRYVYRHQQNS